MATAGEDDLRLRVRALRGGLEESVHEVDVCVTGPDGDVLASSDDAAATRRVFLRSTAKPLQALPAVAAGVLERLGLDDRHLAVACASHAGTDEHVALVRAILDRAGLAEGALACGVGAPLDARVAQRLQDRGEAPGPARHNCSGNHALALALCVVEGRPVDGYLEAGHPVQVAMRDAVREAAGRPEQPGEEGVDGCGMRAYRLELRRLAHAFGRLAAGALGEPGNRVASAMRSHPELVHGRSGVDSALMAAEPGLVAKVGAEGVLAVGLADGRGLALKVSDGSGRALGPAAVLGTRLGLGLAASGERLEALVAPALRNGRGEEVGRLEATVAGRPR